jgi:hypothetical protein
MLEMLNSGRQEKSNSLQHEKNYAAAEREQGGSGCYKGNVEPDWLVSPVGGYDQEFTS